MNEVTYIKIDRSTRLGNWMFQYAAAKKANPDNAVAFVVPEGRDADDLRRYSAFWPEAQYVREVPKGEIVRVGLFQDAKYIDRAMAKDVFLGGLMSATNLQQPIFNVKPLVSIHVRRGDYMTFPHRHPFVGKKYLREAVSRFPNAEFMIFSDDMAWCKRFFKGAQFHFAEGNSVLADLYLMTQCEGGHICSNSTFSWWGAFLGEGKTIFPSMWYGLGVTNIDWQGMYFDGSEVIGNSYSFGLWLRALFHIIKTRCGDVLRKGGVR